MMKIPKLCVIGLAASCWVGALNADEAKGVNAPQVGATAPSFKLTNIKGESIDLSQFQDKTIVLEWFNFGCPFVKKHYKSGNLPKLQADYTAKGVIWLSINSGPENPAAGSFAPAEMLTKATENGNKASHVLLDRTGDVGRAFGAKTTPHVTVIHHGKLVYVGALDSKATPNEEDITTAENYVASALDAVLAGKEVKTPSTPGYGCGVKY